MARESPAPSNSNPRMSFWLITALLYLALQRLESKDWVKAEWGISENNRKARFYTLTAKGRKQLTLKTGEWLRIASAIARILSPQSAEGQ